MTTILVTGYTEDGETSAICNALLERGVDVHLFDIMNFPKELTIHTSASLDWGFIIRKGERELHSDKLDFVFVTLYPEIDSRPSDYARKLHIDSECRLFCGSLCYLIDETRIYPKPFEWAAMGLKPRQLRAASAAGLNIPDTFIGNDPRFADTFLEKNCDNAIAVKASQAATIPYSISKSTGTLLSHYVPDFLMRSGRMEQEQAQLLGNEMAKDFFGSIPIYYTKRFSAKELRNEIKFQEQLLKDVPVTLQVFKEKIGDVRVIIVGDKIYAGLLYTGDSSEGQVDFRVVGNAASFQQETYELDQTTQKALLKTMQTLGLSFGIADFVLDRENKLWFLEINPNGRWLWVEQCTQQPISMALADWIIEKANTKQS